MELTFAHEFKMTVTPTRDMTKEEYEDMMWNLARRIKCRTFERPLRRWGFCKMILGLGPVYNWVLTVSGPFRSPVAGEDGEMLPKPGQKWTIVFVMEFNYKKGFHDPPTTVEELKAACDSTIAEVERQIREFFTQSL